MITQIIKQLQSDDWFNVSEEVETAKGKNKQPKNWKDARRQLKRTIKGTKIYK